MILIDDYQKSGVTHFFANRSRFCLHLKEQVKYYQKQWYLVFNSDHKNFCTAPRGCSLFIENTPAYSSFNRSSYGGYFNSKHFSALLKIKRGTCTEKLSKNCCKTCFHEKSFIFKDLEKLIPIWSLFGNRIFIQSCNRFKVWCVERSFDVRNYWSHWYPVQANRFLSI